MKQFHPNEPFCINLLSLSCHATLSRQQKDSVFIKHNDKRIYPVKGQRFFELEKGQTHKFDEVSLQFPGRVELDTVVLELWYRKNFFQNALAGRFFFMLNISEIGFSATQLIRSSVQEKSHYLMHWEMRSLEASNSTQTRFAEEFRLRNN